MVWLAVHRRRNSPVAVEAGDFERRHRLRGAPKRGGLGAARAPLRAAGRPARQLPPRDARGRWRVLPRRADALRPPPATRRPPAPAPAPAPATATAAPPASAPPPPPPPPATAAGPSDDVRWTVAQLGDHVQRCAAAVTTLQRQLAAVSERLVQGDSRRAAEAEAAAARERAHWDEMKAHVERWSRVVEVLLPQLRDMLDLLRRQQRRGAARRRRRRRAAARARRPLSAAAAPAAAPAARPPVADAARGVPHDEQRRLASRFASGSSERPTCCATTRARSGVRRSRRDYCIHL